MSNENARFQLTTDYCVYRRLRSNFMNDTVVMNNTEENYLCILANGVKTLILELTTLVLLINWDLRT